MKSALYFKPMKFALYSIVLRCHTAESHREVLIYAISRLKPAFWRSKPLSWRVQFARACRELHDDNRRLYRAVMR